MELPDFRSFFTHYVNFFLMYSNVSMTTKVEVEIIFHFAQLQQRLTVGVSPRLPFRVRRRSALSGLRDVRNSALLVNMRYGSVTPRLTRSSMRTPMELSVRERATVGIESAERAAFTPAHRPCRDKRFPQVKIVSVIMEICVSFI